MSGNCVAMSTCELKTAIHKYFLSYKLVTAGLYV